MTFGFAVIYIMAEKDFSIEEVKVLKKEIDRYTGEAYGIM